MFRASEESKQSGVISLGTDCIKGMLGPCRKIPPFFLPTQRSGMEQAFYNKREKRRWMSLGTLFTKHRLWIHSTNEGFNDKVEGRYFGKGNFCNGFCYTADGTSPCCIVNDRTPVV